MHVFCVGGFRDGRLGRHSERRGAGDRAWGVVVNQCRFRCRLLAMNERRGRQEEVALEVRRRQILLAVAAGQS